MSTLKTQISPEQLDRFVKERLFAIGEKYEPIQGGEMAQAFVFEHPDGPRVLRVNSFTNSGFLKDEFVARNFAGRGVRIPKTFLTGEVAPGIWFSVTERVPGVTLDQMISARNSRLEEEIVRTLAAIHAIPIEGKGFGHWETSGEATSQSWREYVISFRNRYDAGQLEEIPFFDRTSYRRLWDKVNQLLEFCPEQRSLVHGDFSPTNLICKDHHITGVIDWQASMYGDPLFDVAWIELVSPVLAIGSAYRDYFTSIGRPIEHFEERIFCYKLLGYSSILGFFAQSSQEDRYQSANQELCAFMEEYASVE
jgi:hygromycin-B 4-O-kinase